MQASVFINLFNVRGILCPKQDPPERQTQGYLQPQDKYVKSVYNKSNYTKSSTQRD